MKVNSLILCNQPDSAAKKCIHCSKYLLSMDNYQYDPLYVCNNWSLDKGCQYNDMALECGNCRHFEDHGLLQCPCLLYEQYVYRKAPACRQFVEKKSQQAKGNFIEDTCTKESKE